MPDLRAVNRHRQERPAPDRRGAARAPEAAHGLDEAGLPHNHKNGVKTRRTPRGWPCRRPETGNRTPSPARRGSSRRSRPASRAERHVRAAARDRPGGRRRRGARAASPPGGGPGRPSCGRRGAGTAGGSPGGGFPRSGAPVSGMPTTSRGLGTGTAAGSGPGTTVRVPNGCRRRLPVRRTGHGSRRTPAARRGRTAARNSTRATERPGRRPCGGRRTARGIQAASTARAAVACERTGRPIRVRRPLPTLSGPIRRPRHRYGRSPRP